MMSEQHSHIRYESIHHFDDETLIQKAKSYFKNLNSRRSLRFFSEKSVPREVIENIIMAASTAPSGANKQPWTFCVISSPELKKQIRIAAEE